MPEAAPQDIQTILRQKTLLQLQKVLRKRLPIQVHINENDGWFDAYNNQFDSIHFLGTKKEFLNPQLVRKSLRKAIFQDLIRRPSGWVQWLKAGVFRALSDPLSESSLGRLEEWSETPWQCADGLWVQGFNLPRPLVLDSSYEVGIESTHLTRSLRSSIYYLRNIGLWSSKTMVARRMKAHGQNDSLSDEKRAFIDRMTRLIGRDHQAQKNLSCHLIEDRMIDALTSKDTVNIRDYVVLSPRQAMRFIRTRQALLNPDASRICFPFSITEIKTLHIDMIGSPKQVHQMRDLSFKNGASAKVYVTGLISPFVKNKFKEFVFSQPFDGLEFLISGLLEPMAEHLDACHLLYAETKRRDVYFHRNIQTLIDRFVSLNQAKQNPLCAPVIEVHVRTLLQRWSTFFGMSVDLQFFYGALADQNPGEDQQQIDQILRLLGKEWKNLRQNSSSDTQTFAIGGYQGGKNTAGRDQHHENMKRWIRAENRHTSLSLRELIDMGMPVSLLKEHQDWSAYGLRNVMDQRYIVYRRGLMINHSQRWISDYFHFMANEILLWRDAAAEQMQQDPDQFNQLMQPSAVYLTGQVIKILSMYQDHPIEMTELNEGVAPFFDDCWGEDWENAVKSLTATTLLNKIKILRDIDNSSHPDRRAIMVDMEIPNLTGILNIAIAFNILPPSIKIENYSIDEAENLLLSAGTRSQVQNILDEILG